MYGRPHAPTYYVECPSNVFPQQKSEEGRSFGHCRLYKDIFLIPSLIRQE